MKLLTASERKELRRTLPERLISPFDQMDWGKFSEEERRYLLKKSGTRS